MDTSTSRCMNLQVTIYVSTELSALILLSIRFLLNRPFQKTSGNLNLVVGLARASLKIVFRGAPGKNMKKPVGSVWVIYSFQKNAKYFRVQLENLAVYNSVLSVIYIYYIYTWGYITTIWHAIIQHPMDFLTSRLFFKTGVFWRDFCSRSTGWIDGRQPVSDHPAVEVVGGKLYGCVDHFVGGCFFWGLLQGVKQKM